jgi:DNA repair photolyase
MAMYKIRPPAIYAHESILADPRYRARVDRVVAAIDDPPDVQVYADEDLPPMIGDGKLIAGRVPMGTLDAVGDPILLFNTFRFDGRREQRMGWLREACGDFPGYHLHESLMGYGPFCWWTEEDPHQRICRPCWRVHLQNGCLHKCLYCQLGGLLVTMVNVEDYLGQFARLIEQNPWQETFLLEDDADVPCLEPELGCLGPIIEFFGTLNDKYLIIHTKSWNVDWMAGLKHKGRTIVVWSISGPMQSERLEPVAGTTAERVEAARKAQQAGYVVRYKFKPIIPLGGWREDAAEAVRMIFASTRPDVISLCVFMWMDAAEMVRRIGRDLLDADCLAAAEAAAEQMADQRVRPFPDDVRAEIYEFYLREVRKHDADVAVSISTEHPGMWQRLGEKLGAAPGTYVCGCGPNSTPWRKTLPCNAFQAAAGGPVGGFEAM